MNWYCSLAPRLLEKRSVKAGDENGSFEPVRLQLEAKVVELYKAILFYQMKSVCSYYKHQGRVFLRNLTKNEWDGHLQRVKDAEEILQKDSVQSWQEYVKTDLGRLVELAGTVDLHLRTVQQAIENQSKQRESIYQDQKDNKYLEDLFVTNPVRDMELIVEKKGGLLSDVCKWVFDTDQYASFTDWRDDGESGRLLWVKGRAGMGKTMLLIGTIHDLGEDGIADFAPSLSYFFFDVTDDMAQNSATAVLRSLIWMLLLQQPELIKHLRSEYQSGQKAGLFSSKYALAAGYRILENMLNDENARPAYFIVDALDECGEGLKTLFNLISKSLSSFGKVKWLVSSRPTINVRSQLERRGVRNLDEKMEVLDLDYMDPRNLDNSVGTYVKYKLATLENRPGYTTSVLDAISKEISSRADATFLWVSFVFQELDKTNVYEEPIDGAFAWSRVKQIPSDLSKLYERMMAKIENGLHVDDSQHCKAVLSATILAYRPLFLSELGVLAGLQPGITPEPRDVVAKCGSFLTINGEAVSVIHKSAKDYLMANYELRLEPTGVARGHADVGMRCIDAMSSALKQNMYSLDFGFQPRDIKPPEPDPLAPIRYSCVFWADHLCLLGSESSNHQKELIDEGRVYRFLKEHFLHWIESISLLGKLGEGIQSIRRLLHTVQLQPAASHQLREFLKDTEKFVLSHGSIIERAPLQIYSSALIFSPTMSQVKNTQWKEKPRPILTVTGIGHHWDAHQQTLEGHTGGVLAVVFSPDGKTIVSASNDHTIRFWDATTGAYQQTLRGHSDIVYAVVFSPDGKMIASASDDRTIRLWDAAGVYKQTLKGHGGGVRTVAFSPDGKTIVSASIDTIRFWDATTGACQQTLEGHGHWVFAVVFSPDGKTIASASEDHAIRLLDATGAYKQTLKGHSGEVYAVVFSPDGKTMASASGDHTIRLWDDTGAYKQTLKGCSDEVLAVVFSPDGKTIVSASCDDTIRLWDTTTGVCQQELKGHRDFIHAVAFSPDGKTFVSASDDRTIRLWDTSMIVHQQTPEGHSGSICEILFSPDGGTIVSASYDKTIRFWDATTGAYQQTLEGHDNWISAVVFSPDGKTIASASWDCTIRLWDATTGVCQQILKGHSSWVIAVVFSPDGRMIVSTSNDHTIRLWNVTTGVNQQTLEGHSETVYTVVFSPDGKTMASASWDGTVRLWDATTGAGQKILVGHCDLVRTVTFSPDGKTIASGSRDGTIRFWDSTTGASQQTLSGQSGVVHTIVFSPDGKMIASASDDRTVRLWDTTTGALQQTFEVGVEVKTLSFDATGSYLNTNMGLIIISKSPTSDPIPMQIGCGISSDGEWITMDSDGLLWLPPEFRPVCSAVSQGASTFALGSKNGRVLIVRFSN